MRNDPRRMGPPNENWMVVTDEGVEYFETDDDAREEAERAVEDYVLEGELQAARRVVWGQVSGYVVRRDDKEFDDARDDEESSPTEADVYDYELTDVAAEPKAKARSH